MKQSRNVEQQNTRTKLPVISDLTSWYAPFPVQKVSLNTSEESKKPQTNSRLSPPSMQREYQKPRREVNENRHKKRK